MEIPQICQAGAHIELQTIEYGLVAKVEVVSIDRTTLLMPSSSPAELRHEAFTINWVGRLTKVVATC